MYLYCDCLNISITSKNVEFAPIESKISNSFTNDSFFDGNIGLLSSCSVNTQVSSLVKERGTGHWKIAICLNCEKSCYAISRALELNSVLARKDLRSDADKFNKLTQSELYSPVFKIIIDTNDLSSDEEAADQKTYLCPAAASWLSEQTALTEEKVKMLSEKEYSALDELRKRVYKEQRAIMRLEKRSAKDSVKKVSDLRNLSDSLSKTLVIEKKKLFERKPSFDDNYMDSEGIFLLDGFDSDKREQNPGNESDSDDSDDESASYNPRKANAGQLAKSLPIPVPQFLEVEDIVERQGDDPTYGTPVVPCDIAASMKALAKSIHGDSIFGELPPPRFSTHL